VLCLCVWPHQPAQEILQSVDDIELSMVASIQTPEDAGKRTLEVVALEGDVFDAMREAGMRGLGALSGGNHPCL
jgi:hypothetical protein